MQPTNFAIASWKTFMACVFAGAAARAFGDDGFGVVACEVPVGLAFEGAAGWVVVGVVEPVAWLAVATAGWLAVGLV